MARVRKVAVLGAGVMGSGIAAHVAGAGVRVLLLDIVPPGLSPVEARDPRARNRFAIGGKEKALNARPAAFFSPADAELIEVGNLEDDLGRLAECDWIVEAVKEELEVKQQLFARVEKACRPDAIVSSNTSGLPLHNLLEGRGEAFRRNFLITHFFNPVRYMKLLELVLGPETDPAIAERIHHFGEDVLGKGIVYAKDTPNFIANRVGTFAMLDAVRLMVEHGLSVAEVDAILGRPLGRPKSAVFRTADIVGLDTLMHVAANCHALLTRDEERAVFEPPAFMKEMVQRNLLGDKSGGGFYKKTREGLLVLDWKTLEYKPLEKPRFASLGTAKGLEDAGERLRAVLAGDDAAARFAWDSIGRTLNYAAHRLGEIADDPVNIDRAMRWGFNWDIGPFEALDALGARATLERLTASGIRTAPALKEMGANDARFYPTAETYRDPRTGASKPVPVSPRVLRLPRATPDRKVKGNDSASLWDIGDGVLCLELHTKMNAVDSDVIAMLRDSIDEAERDWAGLVIGNEATQAFSAGANLFLILMAAREKQWDVLESISREFQQANLHMRHAEVPIVAAPFGLALGGGAEIVLHAPAVRAHAELYMGLVEVGVGLIPAAGGTKEMLFRFMANLPDNADPFLGTQRAFETIALAKVSTSAEHARSMGMLGPCDRVSLSREQLLRDARETVLGLSRAGWRAAPPRKVRVAGATGIANLKVGLWSMRQGNQISDHDLLVGTRLAKVVSGGSVPAGTAVDEQWLLDLEREVFLSLCGEEKSQQRIEYMLTHNKPLRN